jgi:acetyl-CoA carboxylase beta subunit
MKKIQNLKATLYGLYKGETIKEKSEDEEEKKFPFRITKCNGCKQMVVGHDVRTIRRSLQKTQSIVVGIIF